MSPVSKIILILLTFACMVSISGAYTINIEAPDTVTIGSPLVVTGTTSFPEDSYFDLVLFYSKYTAGELKREKVIVDQSKKFRAEFDTRDLKKGQYKIEVHSIISDGKEFVESSLGSASVIRRIVQLTDRSDELVIESQQSQNLSTALVVTGKVKDLSKGVVTLRAFGPDNYTFGPEQLITNPGFADLDGHFSTRIPVQKTGEYRVSFSDKDGFISESSFNVTNDSSKKEEPSVITPLPTTTRLPSPPTVTETPRPPSPTPTKSPIYPGIIFAGVFLGFSLVRRSK